MRLGSAGVIAGLSAGDTGNGVLPDADNAKAEAEEEADCALAEAEAEAPIAAAPAEDESMTGDGERGTGPEDVDELDADEEAVVVEREDEVA